MFFFPPPLVPLFCALFRLLCSRTSGAKLYFLFSLLFFLFSFLLSKISVSEANDFLFFLCWLFFSALFEFINPIDFTSSIIYQI